MRSSPLRTATWACAENLARDCGDFYLRRADGVFAYQLAVVVDDALMGVNEVVRGSDLLSSTARQLWLYRELGRCAPRSFTICRCCWPVTAAAFSKRDGDQSLEHLRTRYSPEEIIGRLAFACGLQNRPTPRPRKIWPAPSTGPRCRKNDICFTGRAVLMEVTPKGYPLRGSCR